MSNKIAEQDITEVNGLGQTVVLVHAGQPIPEGFEFPETPAEKPAPKKRGKEKVDE